METDNYNNGYRDGHLDRYIGISPLNTALTWPGWSLPGYAQGYFDGYFAWPKYHEEEDDNTG